MKILVTGAAGYIGATFCWEAIKKGYTVLGLDNFANSTQANVEGISSKFAEFSFEELDLSIEFDRLAKTTSSFKPDAVVHFCGLKAVGESEANPSLYWKNNLGSTINLLESINCNTTKLIFSSSATVYGSSDVQPINENAKLQTTSAYGSTKLAQEILITDYARTKKLQSVSLRYFNPVGSHADKVIIEDYTQSPNNLMPRLIRVGLGMDEKLLVFGNDFPTSDGTGERDYIHISDLIAGHFAALKYDNKDNFEVFNLGTGNKTTVLELVGEFERTNQIRLKYEIAPRRDGDVATCYADATRANKLLNWNATKNLSEMCRDSWNAALKFKGV